MKRIVILAVIAVFVFAGWALDPEKEILIIENVTVIDTAGGSSMSGMAIVIKGNRIDAVGKTSDVRVPKNATKIDGSGKYLIPGLFDSHIHLDLAGESALPLYIANGVTSVRDMGGNIDIIKGYQANIASGKIVGPRIKTPGPIMDDFKQIEAYEISSDKEWQKTRRLVNSLEDVQPVVSAIVESGVDFLKATTYASKETFFALGSEAKKAGLPFAGHVPFFKLSLIEIAKAGMTSIEHHYFGNLIKLDEAELKEHVKCFLANGTAFCPTLIIQKPGQTPMVELEAIVNDDLGKVDFRRKYLAKPYTEWWRYVLSFTKPNPKLKWDKIMAPAYEFLSKMHKSGVIVLPGTDVGYLLSFPGFSLHDELKMFVDKLGMSPMETLVSATRIPAEFMGVDESLGTIEKGKIADLVLLDADPVEDITNTTKINRVIKDGKVYDQKAIQDLYDWVEKAVIEEN